MTENEFIHIVPQLRQIALQISQGYGVGCDEAEDIAQDAMLKLWAIKEDILSAAHAKGSMGCIAKHLCIDFFRKRKMISIDAQPFAFVTPKAILVLWTARLAISGNSILLSMLPSHH